jgi:seryl-tRNA synthetase
MGAPRIYMTKKIPVGVGLTEDVIAWVDGHRAPLESFSEALTKILHRGMSQPAEVSLIPTQELELYVTIERCIEREDFPGARLAYADLFRVRAAKA